MILSPILILLLGNITIVRKLGDCIFSFTEKLYDKSIHFPAEFYKILDRMLHIIFSAIIAGRMMEYVTYFIKKKYAFLILI